MDISFSIKEYLWMSASDKETLKKILVEANPLQSWPWKQNGTSCGCCNDSRSYEQLKKRVTDKYFEKKVKSLNPHHVPLQKMYVTITILEWLASTWCIYLTEIPKENHLKLSDYLNQT